MPSQGNPIYTVHAPVMMRIEADWAENIRG
jgi:hypothetical protein